ncbi:MAG: lysophospholipid acyltransferase family protein [Pseudomonadota bacterium]
MLHLVIGLATCALFFSWASPVRRERSIQRWSKQLLGICDVRVELKNAVALSVLNHAMIVANHVSWLDIFVINSLQPCRFVAKSSVRNWPLIGWLSAQAGTVYIARGNRADLRRLYEDLIGSMHAGERIAFFPEGTTAGQGNLLPFHANLFEAAIEAKVPIQPYALRYLDAAGAYHAAVDFVGEMSFTASMIVILKSRKITAELIMLPAIDSAGAHRRDLASTARESVAQALGLQEQDQEATA